MLHPVIKWSWRAIWTLISILMTLAGMQASIHPNWVVVLVGSFSWVMFMAMPNLFDSIYTWATVEDVNLRFRRVLILTPFALLAVFIFTTEIFGLALWLGIAISVIVIGFWVYVNLPRNS